jgi:outer membrane receptor for ferrienterochelin and colicins
LNADFDLNGVFKGMLGATYMGVFQVKKSVSGEEIKTRPILTEKWAGNWSLSYLIKKINTTVDYTGNLYGPMRLPALGPLDPRADYSPWWSIQNIQLTYVPSKLRWEIYVGVKNLLNFTPPSNSIARSNDPFDKRVSFDSNGNPVSTTNNPYALTFDPSYVYAPNQGIRGFFGFRYKLW